MKRITVLSVASVALGLAIGITSVQAATVAYWRFEDGVAGTDVTHIAGTDNTFSPDILDVSGNGNHLSTWNTGGCCGYAYRSDVPSSIVPITGAPNNLSVKNTGGGPGMFTSSATLDSMTPAAFTIEASWKMENGGHRTVVGRDARNVATSNGNLAALYLQARPDNSVGILFNDVTGATHEAFSAPGFLQGYDWGSDPEGNLGNWYNLAAVSDGTTLKMFVNGELVASTAIVSADPRLAVGVDNGGDWHAGGWTVGRGIYAGGHGDRAYGFIDEVRISDHAVDPHEFLFPVPEPTSAVLLALGAVMTLARGRKD